MWKEIVLKVDTYKIFINMAKFLALTLANSKVENSVANKNNRLVYGCIWVLFYYI